MSYNNTSIFMGDYGEEGEGVKNAQKIITLYAKCERPLSTLLYFFFKFLAYNTPAIVQGHTSLARPVHPQTPEKHFRTGHYYSAIKPILLRNLFGKRGKCPSLSFTPIPDYPEVRIGEAKMDAINTSM